MKRRTIHLVKALISVLLLTIAAKAGTYSTDFHQYLADNQSEDMISAIITMADRVDLEALKAELSARKANRQEWHETTIRAFQEKATESQADLLAQLGQMQKQGLVSGYQNMWLSNIIIVHATQEAYNLLVNRVDIDQISPNYNIESEKPEIGNNTSLITSGVETNLQAIRANQAWTMGYTGEGRLVSHIDTGVKGNHSALANNWRGLDSRYSENPGWAWFDPVTESTFPFDSGYHGTHTMGTICGLGESTGDTIGVAFDAEWISAGVIDRGDSDSLIVSNILLAMQWVADPDGDASTVWDVPDVCSNSWGVTSNNGYDPCDQTFWEAIDALEATGVVAIFSAGNEGPSAETIRRPADRAVSDISSFSVGSVDGNSADFPISNTSSRGPSYCTDDSSAAIKPEVVAPGINIRSAYIDGGYINLSGTSMAAPHVSGVVALMRQANPDLTSDEIKQILLETARELGDDGEDNTYGMGIIDAYQAVQYALSTLEGWGALAGVITDEATGDPIANIGINVIDQNYSAISDSDGMFYLFIPEGTTYDIEIGANSEYIPLYVQHSVTAGETTYVDYALEPKVAATFTVSFGNGDDISYRNFYIKGSWDENGIYDETWSGEFVALADDGQYPDETASDGIFTAEVILAHDTENTYSWSVYTENYGVNSIDDAFLANGSDFVIEDSDPISVPTLEPNPSGSSNDFVFTVEGDNNLLVELVPGVNSTAYLWNTSALLSANVTYTFTFNVMHGDEAVYGSGGIGGTELTYTPVSDGYYDFIFNDDNDSYIVQPTGFDGEPVYLGATGNLDGHVTTSWLPPGTPLSVEIGYDDGVLFNAWSSNYAEDLMAVMFIPESYPVLIDSVMVHVLTEGDTYWPSFDDTNDSVAVTIYLDNGSGSPDNDPVFYTETIAPTGEWIRVDVDQITVSSGYFWVAMGNIEGNDFDYVGLDSTTNYSANQWYRHEDTWANSSLYDGDQMIRAKVFSDNASTWLSYDDATPARDISINKAGDLSLITIATVPVPKAEPATSNPTRPSSLAYHPHVLSSQPVITETETVTGYNLYRSTTSGPFEQGLKINNSIISGTSYDDWGTDTYGPIVNGTTYYYQVSALYNVGGYYIEIVSPDEAVAAPVNHPPDIPENLTGEVTDNTVTLTWDGNTDYDIAAYNIYRFDYNGTDFELVSTVNHPSVTYSENISTDGIYRYKITAVDAEGMESENYSNSVSLGIGLIPPGTIQSSTEYEFEVRLKWRIPGNIGLLADSVAVVTADGTERESEIMDYMIEKGLVENYTWFNAITSTPELSDLEPYGMVIIWANFSFSDNEELGDVLADYTDLGKPVLILNFSFLTDGGGLAGRFMEDYSPFSTGACMYSDISLGEYDETSPLMQDVNELTEYFYSSLSAQNDAEVVAYWADDYPAVAYSPNYPIVAINGYVGTGNRKWTGDMLQLVYNAVDYLSNGVGNYPDGYNVYRSDSEDGEFELLTSLDGDVWKYSDTSVDNGVSYFYKVTAVYGDDESNSPNIAEGQGENYKPEIPTDFTASVDDHTVSLEWAFTNLMGDFDYYNVYRQIYGDTVWTLIGNTTNESYTNEVTENNIVYLYCVTAVDNGDPQLESDHSNTDLAPVGNLPPNSLKAKDNQDGIVPLAWYDPGVLPCTTLAYDDGECIAGIYLNDYNNLLAKQFIGAAPIEICSVYVHLLTEGDPDWPWPDGQHDPSAIQIWEDDGYGQPGAVLAETTATCNLGEWLVIGFYPPITCSTNNFWISWTYTEAGTDGLGLDNSSDFPEYEWYREDSLWYNGMYNNYDYDTMIRAAISIDGVAELLTENSPTSNLLSPGKTNNNPQVCDTEAMLGYYIYRSTSPDVPIDDDYRITSSYVTDTYYNDEDVINDSTYYYIAIAIYDNSGTVEYSIASNEVSATPKRPGEFAISSTSITENGVAGGEPVNVSLTLTNDGGLPVYYSAQALISDSVATTSSIGENYSIISDFSKFSIAGDKSDASPEDNDSPVITDFGGPDTLGYTWIDSDEPNGPEYNWVDISDIGTDMELTDDCNYGPYQIGFDFPFYDNTFSTFRVCSNGWLSFTATTYRNNGFDMPVARRPYNVIAALWDDLNPEDGGECLYYSNGVDSLIVSWIGVPQYDTEYYYTFQIVLTANGTITLQYADMEDEPGASATAGMQNSDGSDGLTICNNVSDYFHSEMAIQIKTWLQVGPITGVIPPGDSVTVDVAFNPVMLAEGSYNGTIEFAAYDMNHSLDSTMVSVLFIVDDVAIDDEFGSSLPLLFALDQNYPNPFNAHTEIRYALATESDIKLEVYNVLGQKVNTLVDQKQIAGYHSLIWDGTNESGKVVSSGIYLYRLVTNEKTFIKKMIMLK